MAGVSARWRSEPGDHPALHVLKIQRLEILSRGKLLSFQRPRVQYRAQREQPACPARHKHAPSPRKDGKRSIDHAPCAQMTDGVGSQPGRCLSVAYRGENLGRSRTFSR